MVIICGTDLSESSTPAASAAAQLAIRYKLDLHLVYAIELGREEAFSEPRKLLEGWALERLRAKSDRLRRAGARVQEHVIAGAPDDALLDLAQLLPTKLIIVAASGQRHASGALGSRADRIAQRSHVPVLVVRDPAPFEAWVSGQRPLRVVWCADFSLSSEHAVRWLNEFASLGPCEVIATHLYFPPLQFRRLGLEGLRSYLDPDPEVARTLDRELSERLANFARLSPLKIRVEPHLGRLSDRLVEIAQAEHADLVVIGSHHRNLARRLWEGSVSRLVLQLAQSSVACIPSPAAPPAQTLPRLESALVATDFSTTGNAAIALAHAMVAPGGLVHLVHVVRTSQDPLLPHDILAADTAPGRAHEEIRNQLRALVPPEALAQGKATEVHILEAQGSPATAILQAAERLGVDVICLGTHGRSGFKKAILGSVAQNVLENATRPVLLARAPHE